MEILVEKSKSNLDLAKRLQNKENNISAARLYYSVYQRICVLLNKHTLATHRQFQEEGDEVSTDLLKKMKSALSKNFGSHEKVIKALKVFIDKKVDSSSGTEYAKNIAKLQNLREVGDYRNRHVTEDEIQTAFQLQGEIEKVFTML